MTGEQNETDVSPLALVEEHNKLVRVSKQSQAKETNWLLIAAILCGGLILIGGLKNGRN